MILMNPFICTLSVVATLSVSLFVVIFLQFKFVVPVSKVCFRESRCYRCFVITIMYHVMVLLLLLKQDRALCFVVKDARSKDVQAAL